MARQTSPLEQPINSLLDQPQQTALHDQPRFSELVFYKTVMSSIQEPSYPSNSMVSLQRRLHRAVTDALLPYRFAIL